MLASLVLATVGIEFDVRECAHSPGACDHAGDRSHGVALLAASTSVAARRFLPAFAVAVFHCLARRQ